jgi:hypothetical protein
MKIVYIADTASPKVFYVPYSNLLLLTPLSEYCTFIECNDLETTKREVQDADVVYLENYRALSFKDDLLFLNNLPLFICASYCDIWRQPWWGNFSIRIDAHIGVYRDCAKRALPWYDKYFWSPCRVHKFDFEERERDIDIIFWGQWKDHSYDFRKRVYLNYIQPWTKDKEPIQTPNGRYDYNIEVNSKTYKLCVISQHGDHFGSRLYELLNRSKIAISGPMHKKGSQCAAGKFFENAMYGAVNITPYFHDSEDLGFIDRENIWYTNEDKFVEDLGYLLENSDIVSNISKNSMEMAISKHTDKIRAKEFYNFLKEKTGEE